MLGPPLRIRSLRPSARNYAYLFSKLARFEMPETFPVMNVACDAVHRARSLTT